MTARRRRVFSRPIGRALLTAAALLALASGAVAAEKGPGSPGPAAPSAEECALLDDPKLAGRMDGLLKYLAKGCGREAEFIGGVRQEGGPEAPDFAPEAADVAVSDPTDGGGAGTSAKTQSETSIAYNPVTGTLCAAWNDAYHGVTENLGFSGFGRSTDGGATWDDRGPISTLPGQQDSGDPSLVWRQLDGKFYYAALLNGGLGIYRSDDDCMSFTFVNQFVSGSDDKEIMAVDNNPASPYYGRLYVVWTDFGAGARIYSIHSSDAGATWSTQLAISPAGEDVQGAWPVVAPNGDVYVGWVTWLSPGFPSGNVEATIARSTDGGVSYSPVNPPMTNETNPRDSAATGSCGRPALGGNIRYLPSPQLAVDGNGHLHAVYSYDPDAFNVGDESNVYYRKSTDGGATWQPEVLINDDGGTTDQYQPSMSIGAGNVVTIGYYSRQNDAANNLLLDYYSRTSFDAGATWAPSVRLSDVSTPVVLDSTLATCYHGDYDTQTHSVGKAHYLWSDDRDPDAGGTLSGTPNIYTEFTPAGTDFLPVASVVHRSICFPASTTYPIDVFQFQGFSEPVTMTSSGFPPGYIDGFTTNPVAPGGSTTLEINNTGASAAGDYTITVTGTSSPGGIVRQTAVTLELFVGTPGAPTLTAPADGEIDTARGPVLDWDPQPTAVDYLVEVATDAGFTNIVRSATVAETSWAVSPQLDILTTYHWRVTADNPCGDDVSSTFDFTTANPTILLVDDDDNGPDVQTTYNSLLNAIAVYDIWDTTAQGSEPTALDLAPYQAVIWFSGDAFSSTTPRAGPQAAGETALATYLDSGRCLLLSSQDYLWDNLGSGTQDANPFMATYLGLDSATSDSGDYTSVDGRGFFSTLGNSALSFPYSDFSDELVLGPAAQLAFEGNNLKDGAISKLDGNHFTTFMSFGIETLPEAKRTALIDRFLTVCEAVRTMHVDDFESNSFDRWDAVGAAAP